MPTPKHWTCLNPAWSKFFNMSAQTSRILDELARTGIDLLLREPFYAHVFGSLNKEIVGEGHPVDTLAVGLGRSTLTLYVNAGFWDQVLTDPAHRFGVVKHEMLHLVFRHLFVREPFLDPGLCAPESRQR